MFELFKLFINDFNKFFRVVLLVVAVFVDNFAHFNDLGLCENPKGDSFGEVDFLQEQIVLDTEPSHSADVQI